MNTESTSSLNVKNGVLEFTNGDFTSSYSVSQYSGGIEIYGGATLKADANTLMFGGTLWALNGGVSTLTGDLVVAGGTIAIGDTNHYNSLAVQGDVSIVGATLSIGIDQTNNLHDSLVATGTITLEPSATLVVTTVGAGPATQTYDILVTVGAGTQISNDFGVSGRIRG